MRLKSYSKCAAKFGNEYKPVPSASPCFSQGRNL
jgi:hypothetical protein